MELSEIAYFTEDGATLTAFYRELLGEPVVEGDGISIFDANGVQVLVHEIHEPGEGDYDVDLPSEDHLAFTVEDVDDAFETLTEEGLTPFREPADYDWGRSAYLQDPDGRLVELAEE